ncbi:hypothetical protein DPMN_146136 [Dreissena polymorpha]|uniref:Uncharacterized protein n=1 Tax=Dreissena polymorpha TaxID=45954 RepID=A0A9D4F5B8_DREPO|nr:hypothetical protein DPMN_146136 [Dreissena polymorpha]
MWAPVWAPCGLPTWDPDGECNRAPYESHQGGPMYVYGAAQMGPMWSSVALPIWVPCWQPTWDPYRCLYGPHMGGPYTQYGLHTGSPCTEYGLHTGSIVLNMGYMLVALYSIWFPQVHRACKILDNQD